MARTVQKGEKSKLILYETKKQVRMSFLKNKKSVKTFYFFAVVTSFKFPILSILFFTYMLIAFYKKVFNNFFKTREHIIIYNNLLSPVTANEVVSKIGYEIYPEDIQEHLALVKNDSKEAIKNLANKQKKYQQPQYDYLHIGLSEKIAKTHLVALGKTGAGKTEFIRTMMDDIFRFGGGIIYVDGKADTKIYQEFQLQSYEKNRETSNYVVNFNKAELLGESNTLSILGLLHPIKIVEFLGSLARKGEGDANSEHFFNKGKAMLYPVVNGIALRNKFYKEGMNFDKIADGTTPVNMAINQIVFYCMLRDIEQRIRNNNDLVSLLDSSVSILTTDPKLKYIEKIVEYATQFPAQLSIIEEKMGISYITLKEIYTNTYLLYKTYLETVWNQYGILLNIISRIIYVTGCAKEKSFFIDEYKSYNNCYSLNEIKDMFNYIQELFESAQASSANGQKLSEWYSKYNFAKEGITQNNITTLIKGMTSPKSSISDPPEDAIQQHSYAQQQWQQLFATIGQYKHIFGQSIGEVQPEKILKNNKFLYVLLPVFDLQPAQVEILGKMQIMLIREVASLALGGEKLSIHRTVANIFKDSYTPKPFTLIVLDEYGAFPVDGLDTILAQVRSLNMSVVIGIQDMISLKVGQNEVPQKRAMANLSKLLFKIEDKDMVEWVKGMVSKIEVENTKYNYDAVDNIIADNELTIAEKESFNPEIARDFDKGFAVLQTGGGIGGTTFLQTFYQGGKAGNIMVKRYYSFD